MSAPDTNTQKEERRHRPALLGIRGAMIVVAILFVGWLIWIAAYSSPPEGADEQIESGVGQVEQSEGATNTEEQLDATTNPVESEQAAPAGEMEPADE